MNNFIRTANPFALADPPDWFLKQLAAQEPRLVIFQSTSEPLYRIGVRCNEAQAGLNKVLKAYPDSEIFYRNRLWAWKSVEPMCIGGTQHGMTWQKLLLEIPEYDQQRFGTATECADALDAMDEQQERAVDRDNQGKLDALNHDAYLLASSLAGTRVGLTIRKPEGARASRSSRKRAYRPPNFGGGGAIFIGR